MPRTAETQRRRIRTALATTGTTADEAWARYRAVGGQAGLDAVVAFLDGSGSLPSYERDRLALAVDGMVGQATDEDGRARARGPELPDGPLGALVELLLGTHLAPPESIPEAVDAAATRLGVEATAYVVDHQVRVLVPLPGRWASELEPISLEGTTAGRAYRMLQTVTATVDGRPCLWVPIIDGVERLGALRVLVPDAADLVDPVLRRDCWWFTHLLGHLMTAVDEYGDGLDRLRRRRPRTTEAELVWNLLPPLTAATESVIVTGRLEPAHAVGGDVFDYALGPTSARFAILDATGHDLSAGLASAAGLAAYRNARRNGKGLFEQAESVHRTLEVQFKGDVYATAVFAELDTVTGRLRYLVAGHPSPLILRQGHVVKELAGGRRPMLGLDMRQGVTLGEEHLEPGDTVVLFTDGITEARAPGGEVFGMPLLVDLLEREESRGLPLPEVTDRLLRAVLQHQGDVLQDDATLLLVQWTTEGQAVLEPDPAR
jgi:hypothetical protein